MRSIAALAFDERITSIHADGKFKHEKTRIGGLDRSSFTDLTDEKTWWYG
jgi:hypothetical protein